MASGFAEDVGERGTHRNRGGGLEAAQGVDGFRQGVGGDGGDVVGLVPVNQQAPIGVAGFAQARKDGLGVELLFEGGHHDVIAPRHFDRGIELDGVGERGIASSRAIRETSSPVYASFCFSTAA